MSVISKRIGRYIANNNNNVKTSAAFEIEQKYIDEFIQNGVVVIPNLIDNMDLTKCRKGFHMNLKQLGCDPDNLLETAGALSNVSSTGGAGGILDIFYAEWKLALNEHPRIVAAFIKILSATYASNDTSSLWSHPFGKFNPKEVFMYIDRCCFRVPEKVSLRWKHKRRGLQRSLTPHLDCCPHKLFSSEKTIPKWRPIQAFVALTDTLNENEGGFEAAPGMHVEFDNWVATRKPTVTETNDGEIVLTEPPCVGDFTPIRPKEDIMILDKMKHIPVKAGDVVFWDYRIAHANSRRNNKDSAREVVYLGLLPGVGMNKNYAEKQLERYREGNVPQDQWHEYSGQQMCTYRFSSIGRKMMTIDSYV